MIYSDWLRNTQGGQVIFCVAFAAVAAALFLAIAHLIGAVSSQGATRQAASDNASAHHWAPFVSEYGKQSRSTYAANCTSPKDHEEADLCQQWRAAQAAERSAALTDAQTYWNNAQVVSTILATLCTAFAAWAAATAAASSRKTVEKMEEISRQELRAYVGLEKIEFEVRSRRNGYQPVGLGDPNVIFKDFISVTIKNFGATPAYDVMVLCGGFATEFLGRAPVNHDYDRAIQQNRVPVNFLTKMLLSPAQPEVIKCPLLNATPYWQSQQKERSMLVYGRVYYRDAYSRPWSTKFCFVWEPWHPGGARFVPYEEFNGEDISEAPA